MGFVGNCCHKTIESWKMFDTCDTSVGWPEDFWEKNGHFQW
jgi:hypothetical protein